MALNDLTASILTRSTGGNAIARAAYNARECLHDEATAQDHDYRYKGGLEARGIHVAQNAPEWAKQLGKDREKLWNEVERREDKNTRPDQAQLARDFKIALPHELNEQQRLYLVKDFARELSRQGMIVDWAIHTPNPHSDERNYHVHILTTMRRLEEDGFGHKMRQLNKVEQLEKWKERWSELGAKAIERAGERSGREEEFRQEADRFRHGHRTLKVQREEAIKRGDMEHAEDCLRDPTIHLGPHVSAMERRGIKTDKGDVNRSIKEQNRQRAAERNRLKEPPEHLKGYPLEIWRAWNNNDKPKEFAKAMKEKRLELASVTKEEAERSRKEGMSKPYREGEIVVVTEPRMIGRKDGQLVRPTRIYRLDKVTTGATPAKVEQFLAPLDRKRLVGIDATLILQNQRYTDRMDKMDRARSDRADIKDVAETLWLGRKAGSILTGTLGSPAGKVADIVEAFFAPKQTPQEVRQGERAQQQREADGHDAVVRRQQEADREKDHEKDHSRER